jgi:hypothetical protein
MSNKYVLIKWIEDPPKWDIVPIKSVHSENVEPGHIVDVVWSDGTAAAQIIDIGKCFKIN